MATNNQTTTRWDPNGEIVKNYGCLSDCDGAIIR